MFIVGYRLLNNKKIAIIMQIFAEWNIYKLLQLRFESDSFQLTLTSVFTLRRKRRIINLPLIERSDVFDDHFRQGISTRNADFMGHKSDVNNERTKAPLRVDYLRSHFS